MYSWVVQGSGTDFGGEHKCPVERVFGYGFEIIGGIAWGIKIWDEGDCKKHKWGW